MKKYIAILALLAALPANASAQEAYYEFDKAHTQILFFADHLGFSKSQGEFLDYDGYFLFNRTKPEKSYVEITIKTDSIDMDHERWDNHMKSEDFFNVEKFPTMDFRSTGIEVLSDSTADITGDLTILGITAPVVLHTVFNKAGRHPFNQKYVAGFSAHTTVDRSVYGMTYGVPMIGDDVELRIEVEGIRKDEEGQEPLNP
jgi:polyisoprenoid-binding protein YceI